MDQIYDFPQYYELAFSWRDLVAETTVLEACIAKFSRIPVRTVLEIACGPAPHLPELHRRGYRYVGVDLSRPMLDWAAAKAARAGADATLVQADLRDFALPEPADFAYVLLGSLIVPDTAGLDAHFDAVSRALRPGGLYLMDWCLALPASEEQTWEAAGDGIRITIGYVSESVDPVEQTSCGTDTMEVNDHGRLFTLVERETKRSIGAQEFRIFIRHRPDFEFVGWWNNWDLDQPLRGDQKIARPIIIVRRT